MYVGTAYFTMRRRNLTTAFRYDDVYLARPDAVPVDPHLPLVQGAHRVDGLPGTFRDSSPA
ncbi:HipA N-terminal domain-containing protein [Myceligenerans xiligouense]|uniref:HipA N-terminal domain-containing protein n=1 Tax=Myceligenerans xiligouense TaxID=253184 RepID=UPI000F4DF5D6|nr:HipA N-terminal domain-containing protein [Myceligenerans xiligouense]